MSCLTFKKITYFLFPILLSCAQFITITGGDKDTTPPRLVEEKTYPKNQSLNFTAREITLTFDEYFTLTNPTEKVLISPSLENKLDFTVKGKELKISLNNVLDSNTTYSINFSGAIKDYHANNELKNFTYAFSTGNYIDSMEVTGKVIDAKTGKSQEDIMVGLYKDFNDSVVSTQKPFYFTKTDKQGLFKLQNIKNGRYKIFALKDENRNFLFDLPNEKIAFTDSIIELDTANSTQNILKLFEEDYKKQRITSKTLEYPGKLTLTFEKPNTHVSIGFGDSINIIHQHFSEMKDTAWVWLNGTIIKKFSCIVSMDSITDTTQIAPYKKTTDTTLKLEAITNQIKQNEALLVSLNRPIKAINSSYVLIEKDSVSIPFQLIMDSLNPENTILEFEKKFNTQYRITFFPNAFTDVYNNAFLDTVIKMIQVYEKDYFGFLSMQLENTNDSTTYWLYVKQGETILKKEKYQGEKVNFGELAPGKYSIEVLVDENNNNRWDSGNYYKKIYPEKILIFDKEIKVRSNWELKETWDVSSYK